MIDKKVFEQLKARFGTDSKAAEALGVTPRHYSRVKIAGVGKASLVKLMVMLAREDSNHVEKGGVVDES